MTTSTTLWRARSVYTAAAPGANALTVNDGMITWVGDAADAPAADRVVDCPDTVITPSFVDSHAHVAGTGARLTGFDPTGARNGPDLMDRLNRYARTIPADAVIIAHGWDETTWDDPELPTAVELERAGEGRQVYLSRTCGHSGIASAGLLEAHPSLVDYDGFDSSGVLTRQAHRQARARANASIGPEARRAISEAALRHAASLGITALVEHFIPIDSDPYKETEFTDLIALGRRPDLPEVFGWWGELNAAERARDLGAYGCGGDLSVDGSVGARTAALRDDYADAPGERGTLYYSAEQVGDHIVNCHRFEMPAAFHAIGDAAIDTVLAGFDRAAEKVDIADLRTYRHRIEHVELLSESNAAAMVHYGLHASVQPAFDATWGGKSSMYATRMGEKRALAANPWSHMYGVGIPLAFGSDSPVTDIDPWGGVRAGTHHHNSSQSLSAEASFAAATRGGWRAVGRDDVGVLAPGFQADFAVWNLTDDTLTEWSDPRTPEPTCQVTVAAGEVIHELSQPRKLQLCQLVRHLLLS
ncbi:amidohydrolase [Haloglycomyces albus]|uniref:amidohydrolase n=1 Tax=Haloglycomyces albus TaxID=526067 RepID=UPI00046CAC06|nr:amidohydrolase family protein [Haloglycomyces albus]